MINGTNDENTTFDPDLQVTYAQAVKMLVCAAGYEQWAINIGGWPGGYLKYGGDLGVGNGVSGVSNDTPLTRGQCAQMISNILTAPVCKEVGWIVSGGQSFPDRRQMNGSNGNSFESLLTNNWKIYEVYGTITATRESDGLQVGKVNYNIMKTQNYDKGNVVVSLSQSPHRLSGITDKTGYASSTLNQYTRALIHISDDDEESIVYIEISGKNNEVDFSTKNYYSVENLGTSSAKINIYKSEMSSSTTSYRLSQNAGMQVNGVNIDLTEENCNAYLKNNSKGKAVLIDTPSVGGSTDGKYDYIIVDYCVDAVVDEVVTRSSGIRVSFDCYDASGLRRSYLEVDPDSDDISYTFLLNGNTISVSDLRHNDVLSLQFDPSCRGNIDSSSFVKAIVSRDSITGTVDATGTDSDGSKYYRINGTKYNLAGCCDSIPEIGYTYTAYLDVYGDIAKLDQNSASVSYAIVDRFYTDAGDQMVRIISKTGQKESYRLKADNAHLLGSKMQNNTAYTDSQVPIEDRIISYNVNSSNELTIRALVSDLGGSYTVEREAGTYNKATQRVGSFKVSDASIILDASSYADNPSDSVVVSSVNAFKNDMDYTVVFAGKMNSDTAYPFVVIVEGDYGYSTQTQLAVYSSEETRYVDGYDRTIFYVFKDGSDSATPIVLDSNIANSGLTQGDAIIYKTNSDGYVDDYKIIMKLGANTIASNRNALAYTNTPNGIINSVVNNLTFSGGDTVSFAFGPVIERGSGYVTLGNTIELKNGIYQSSRNGKTYSYASDVKVYVYDGAFKKNMVSGGTHSAVMKSTISNSNGYVDKNKSIINWNSEDSVVNWALVRLVDRNVKEIYAIISASDADYRTNSLSPSPTATATPTATADVTSAPTAVPTPVPTATPTLSTGDDPKPTATAVPTATVEPTATATAAPTATAEPTATATTVPTATADVTSTPTATPPATPLVTQATSSIILAKPAPTAVPTSVPTATPIVSERPTATPVPTPTLSLSDEPFSNLKENAENILVPKLNTPSPTSTIAPTPTSTATIVPTALPTTTPTAAPTALPTAVPTTTPTATPVSTVVPTIKPVSTATVKPTSTATVKPTATPTLNPHTTPTASPSPTPLIKSKIQLPMWKGFNSILGKRDLKF